MPRSRARQLTDAIGAMEPEHLICRDYGHSWERVSCVHIVGKRGHVIGYQRQLICVRCKSARREELDRYGDPTRKGYRYAAGYQVHGLGRLTGADRGQLRVASMESGITGDPVHAE